MTDVNTAFAQSKRDQISSMLAQQKTNADRAQALRDRVASQVESGEMTDLGGNRYRVNVGYDRGEVLYLNTTAKTLTLEQIEDAVRGDHGLDLKADGSAALYLKDEPAWHGLGTVIKGGSSSAKTVLDAAGLNWDTLKVPFKAEFQPEKDEPTVTRDVPGKYLTVRSDTMEVLGVVGEYYHAISNLRSFEFLDKIFGDHLMIAETAGSFRDGRRVFISAELPEGIYIDPNGVNDHIRLFLMLINGHDGQWPFKAVVTPWRPLCKNTERFALRDAVTSWTVRHTKTADSRIQEARKTLRLTRLYWEEFQKEETALIQVPFNGNAVDKLIDAVWGEMTEDSGTRAKNVRERTRSTIQDLYAAESKRVGRTAYAAERAVTEFVDHYTMFKAPDLKGKPLQALGRAILEEANDEPKRRAHKALMELTRR